MQRLKRQERNEEKYMNEISTTRVKAISIAFVLVVFVLILASKLQDNTISITVDGENKQLVALSSTVEDLLIGEGIVLNRNTKISPALNTLISDGMEIEIDNIKTYAITNDGEVQIVKSYSTTVEGVIKDAGIELKTDDYLCPSSDALVKSGDSIVYFPIVKELIVENIPLSYNVIRKENSTLNTGYVKTIQEGVEGEKRVYKKDVYIGDKLSYSTPVYEATLSSPVPKIVEFGTKQYAVSRGGSRDSASYSKVITMNASAYDLSFASTGKRPGDYWYGKTASGTYARPGTVAVDPKVIPLGTKLYVESMDSTPDYGFANAEDTGGAIKGNRIDLFFNSNRDAMNFGRRSVKVYILD